MAKENLKEEIAAQAKAAGFSHARVTKPQSIGAAGEAFKEFLAKGFHGEMAWMETHAERRADPQRLWPEVKSIIMLGMNYGPHKDPLALLQQKTKGAISVYARGKDYHDLVKKKLKQVARWLHHETCEEVKVFVDTAPVLEKPLAAASGIGWQGKHTNLVSRELGSWLFLGAIFTTADLDADEPELDHCGTCRRCLDACPTKAFPAPYLLDARRCISYLTIEYKGHIAPEFRKAMGNRIYGCDDCLAVCPWNKWAQQTSEMKLMARPEMDDPELTELLMLDDAGFRLRFAGSPIKRTGRDRFIRNVLIAAGNAEDKDLFAPVTRLLADPAPVVRAMAVWASKNIAAHDVFEHLRARHLPSERDAAVLAEWGETSQSRSALL